MRPVSTVTIQIAENENQFQIAERSFHRFFGGGIFQDCFDFWVLVLFAILRILGGLY